MKLPLFIIIVILLISSLIIKLTYDYYRDQERSRLLLNEYINDVKSFNKTLKELIDFNKFLDKDIIFIKNSLNKFNRTRLRETTRWFNL